MAITAFQLRVGGEQNRLLYHSGKLEGDCFSLRKTGARNDEALRDNAIEVAVGRDFFSVGRVQFHSRNKNLIIVSNYYKTIT